ncbi:Disease resistance protein CC-NBS-LRR class family [Salix suchowensis]|nr:Disease resistance protein CC-NBS-LRR class family [Salix suchowensis]
MTFYDGNLCLADSATTHTILKENKYFKYLTLTKANVTTISGPVDMIKGSGKANIVLPNNTILSIKDALYSPESRRNLLSFKDIRANGYHIETTDEDRKEYLYIIARISG